MPGPDRQGTPEGLTSAEAAERLRRYGPNELALARRFETFRRIAGWLASPLITILLLASVVSAALGQVVSSVVIGLMVLLGAALNFIQAYRSQVAARRRPSLPRHVGGERLRRRLRRGDGYRHGARAYRGAAGR